MKTARVDQRLADLLPLSASFRCSMHSLCSQHRLTALRLYLFFVPRDLSASRNELASIAAVDMSHVTLEK